MGYQWGPDAAGQYQLDFKIRMFKSGPPYVPVEILVQPDAMGDWNIQMTPDLAGELKTLLEGGGWTVEWIKQSGIASRPLEEAPPE